MMDRSRDLRIWAVVPVKPFGIAKQRLAPVLDADARATLARGMFRDVMAMLARLDELAGIVVVTSDPVAAEIAAGHRAHVVPDRENAGVSRALAQAVPVLKELGCEAMLALPADIPYATAAELRSAVAALRDRAVVLVPATGDGGTNLLAARPPDAVAFCFGPDSFARHVAAARAAGLEAAILDLPGVGRDIDGPADLRDGMPWRPEDIGAQPRHRTSQCCKTHGGGA
jgi:2-phospho-L-lactate guanylyltransferase